MISPGSPYGVLADAPPGAVEVNSDGAAADVLSAARRQGVALPALLLRGGDLYRTLGGLTTLSPDSNSSRPSVRFPVDLGVVEVDGAEYVFVAHAVLRSRAWRGPFLVAMNAQWCGPLDLGPRSHPADGRLDITSGKLRLAQRLEARRRARSGTHLPHPDLSIRRTRTEIFQSDRTVTLYLDGQRVLRCAQASLRVEPDALTVYI